MNAVTVLQLTFRHRPMTERITFTLAGVLLGLAGYTLAGVGWYVSFWFSNNPPIW